MRPLSRKYLLVAQSVLLLLMWWFPHVASAVDAARGSTADLLRPFEITGASHPFRGLLRRSAHAGLDWYFTSLALALAPDETLLSHREHFEQALRQLPVAGPMPLNPSQGLRRISDSSQLWELVIDTVHPWAWDCAWPGFPKGAPVDWAFSDPCGRVWRNWGRVALDGHWSLHDTTDDFMSVRQPDSHDSQAAVFLYALARWWSLTRDADWLQTPVWQWPPDSALTASQSATQSANRRLWLQRIDLIKLMVRHNLLNHMQDGLFRTFRHNRHPDGTRWDVQYLMDNIECLAALRALIPLFDDSGHTAFADILRHYEGSLSDSLQQMFAHVPSQYLRWARQADWPTQADELAFYPHIAGQYWFGLFAETRGPELVSRWTQLEPQLGHFSDWWRHGNLHLAAGLPPYLARLRVIEGSLSDQSPRLLKHAQELRPDNSVISDYVAAWQLSQLLAPR